MAVEVHNPRFNTALATEAMRRLTQTLPSAIWPRAGGLVAMTIRGNPDIAVSTLVEEVERQCRSSL
jgi:hypothetical protein